MTHHVRDASMMIDTRALDVADGRSSDDTQGTSQGPNHLAQDGFIDGNGSTLRRQAGPSLTLTAAVRQAEYMAEEMRNVLDKRTARTDELRDAVRIGLAAMALLQGAGLVVAKKVREQAA